MTFKVNEEVFEIKEELTKEFEKIWGRPYSETKFTVMYHQALEIHEKEKYNHKIIENEINNLLNDYNRVSKKLPELLERIEKGDYIHC